MEHMAKAKEADKKGQGQEEVIEGLGTSTGLASGAFVGALAGSLAGPLGMIIGGSSGAAVGAMIGITGDVTGKMIESIVGFSYDATEAVLVPGSGSGSSSK
jgi:hypothetical protein